jgi:hypothetical protein
VHKASAGLPLAAAGASIAVAVGLTLAGFLLVRDSRGEIADLVSVAQRARRAEIERFAGRGPDRCVHARPGRELCRWSLAGRVVTPSGSAAVEGPVNLVCELPTDAASPAPGSCFARGRAVAAEAEGGLPPVSAPADASERARHAAGLLAEARNVGELSLLVGDVPDACHTVHGGQLCRWELRENSAARERLAALAPGEGALELRCLLPLEDVERPQHSCAVVER